MIGRPYLQLLWTYVPKTVLMLLVLAILLALVLKRRPQQLGKARPLALSAIGLLLANTLAVPVTYAWLVQAAARTARRRCGCSTPSPAACSPFWRSSRCCCSAWRCWPGARHADGLPQRLRGLLHRALDHFADPGHGAGQAGRRRLRATGRRWTMQTVRRSVASRVLRFAQALRVDVRRIARRGDGDPVGAGNRDAALKPHRFDGRAVGSDPSPLSPCVLLRFALHG